MGSFNFNWFVLLITQLTTLALLTGFAASFVQFGVEWLSDLKFGYCSTGFWVSSFLCCQEYSGNGEYHQVVILKSQSFAKILLDGTQQLESRMLILATLSIL